MVYSQVQGSLWAARSRGSQEKEGGADGKTGILQGGSGMALRRSEGNKVTFPV